MPGKSARRSRIPVMRLSRISSLTDRWGRRPAATSSRSAPRVRGRAIAQYYAMPSPLLSLDTPVVIAHRGGAGLRPENTMAAFEHAVSLGVDAVECDVHLARDGEVVVIHDDTLDRTTDARGPGPALTAAEPARGEAGGAVGASSGSAP